MRKNYRKKKFNKKKKNTYKIFFLVLVGMTVGFAAINTTLQLIGTLNIARTTWNIHWENPTKVGGVTATQDVHLKQDDNTTVEYQVKLTNPGDYYEFTVDAKNDGTIDAMITDISNKIYENNVEVTPTYLESTITYANGTAIDYNHLLGAGRKETYKVKVQYKTGLAADQLPDQEKTYNFRFTVTYMQADESQAVDLHPVHIPTNRTVDTLQVGDEISIENEKFNFVRYDGNDIVMLAKYNLKVGYRFDGDGFDESADPYHGNEPGYGLQSSEARGYVYGALTWNGTEGFSEYDYWYIPNTNTLDPVYGNSFPADIYDATNYSGYPEDSNYSVAYYVEAYKNVLSGYGATIKDARLLTYSEAIDSSIGCTYNTSTDIGSCPTNGFITNTSFWLGSTNGGNSVMYIDTNGNFSEDYCRRYHPDDYIRAVKFGVRPVIVISKSDI